MTSDRSLKYNTFHLLSVDPTAFIIIWGHPAGCCSYSPFPLLATHVDGCEDWCGWHTKHRGGSRVMPSCHRFLVPLLYLYLQSCPLSPVLPVLNPEHLRARRCSLHLCALPPQQTPGKS